MKISFECGFITKNELVIRDTKMYSYTFTDLASGNNFTVFSIFPVKKYDTFKQLQSVKVDFDLLVAKNNVLKLKPIKEDIQ